MNWIDILLVVIIGLGVWSGWGKGFILGTLNLITWIGSLAAALYGYPYLSAFIQRYTAFFGVWTMLVAFLIVLILARIVIAFISNQVLKTLSEETHYGSANKLFGLLPGLVNGIIYASILSFLLSALPAYGIAATTRNSKLANNLRMPANWAAAKLAPVFNKPLHRSGNKITLEPKPNESVTLPFTVLHPQIRSDLETQMLSLVNEERSKKELLLLKADAELTKVARAHSKDMFARGYFAHYTPEGKDPFDRMRAAHITFTAAGENLALAPTLSLAHTGLMNSPGHRANILRPAFGRVGIGIVDGGIYGLMISQEFRN